jgi:cullin 1
VVDCRWAFLERGIDSVMLKLEEGVDMKTVCILYYGLRAVSEQC